MTIFYSAETNGFYDSSIHSVMPSDAVQITKEQHQALLLAQEEGKVITPDNDGKPSAVERPQASDEVKWARIRKQRNELLQACDWVLLEDSGVSESDLIAWKQYRQELRDLPNTQPLNGIQWPEKPS